MVQLQPPRWTWAEIDARDDTAGSHAAKKPCKGIAGVASTLDSIGLNNPALMQGNANATDD